MMSHVEEEIRSKWAFQPQKNTIKRAFFAAKLRNDVHNTDVKQFWQIDNSYKY